MPEELRLVELFPIFAVYLGSSVCIITFIGCLASIAQSAIWIRVYALFLTILCVLQITFSSFYLHKEDEIMYKSTAIVVNAWRSRGCSPEIMDNVQLIGQCCGLQSPFDYNGTVPPSSCCGYGDNEESCELGAAYQEGCASGFPNAYLSSTCWIIYYGYFVAGIELGAVAIAWFVEFGGKEEVTYVKEHFQP